MAGPVAPRRRLFPDLLTITLIYVLVALGAYVLARQILGGAPDFPGLERQLPLAVLAILPLSLAIILVLRVRTLVIELRVGRYGSRLRAKLAALFLLTVAAASLPQGAFLLRLATRAQAASSSAEIRKALAAGNRLALAWYDEELSRIERAAAELPVLDRKGAGAVQLLDALRGREPRMEALEVFERARSLDFAGAPSARLAAPPPAPTRGTQGTLLPASASGDASRIRYAAAWSPGGSQGYTVLTLRLPESLGQTAELLGRASRTAELLAPFSARWSLLLGLLYAFLVLPLLFLAGLLGLAAADLVSEPLASLEDATRRVAAGDFGVRLIVKPGDETGHLVASFNRMLGEIERYRSDELRKEKIDAWKDIAQRLAHELKNPLTPIRLAAERVLRRWKLDQGKAASIIESSMLAIVKEVEGMDALLSDFRSFASLPEPQRYWVELRPIVEESIALYAASYPEVRFSVDGVAEGLSLRVDRAAVKRALGNLISNAIDAMEGAGEIEFTADLVKAADSRYCRLRVRDNGRGIPASVGDKVFVPYFTTKPEGTGLGLAIVERIVADHGGEIRFESEEGAGATFFVDLPLDR
ncbi:MAG TPA: ATP-binding protein [Rectinemataceae bacterium]|nr:ATP-binding protein [Rectinemataceae bacterium]